MESQHCNKEKEMTTPHDAIEAAKKHALQYDDAREVWDMDKTVAQNLTAMKKKLFKDQP
jgi:hypothetical protein